ncbi:YqaE/Pmp3 family membrane protein [Chitinophaga sancti]|uniref:Proteolipid membrane potential modulator n=1 Tax=Chitinophaga sancti TaxID=1004 RepID=A0A1K1RI87_9BACT|nr:YqaE/Pmp3 family membrane protein [Chitinophaga sancti]WQD60628.1 YqaE/Pmp3 family membrane protein [Chitinophaga sancti]WQG87244.1 YqaE/Pmp3 family membrane protein [Chitinophaga sancti]SFW71556.1 Proteolipid membrane potential modulator [Chitinophaga sancti]
MTLIAILLPWLSFLLRGKLLSGILCLILQCTILGWIPAAIWAVISLDNSRADRRNRKLIKAIKQNRGNY